MGKPIEKVLWELLVGKKKGRSKGRRSSSGRRKSGSHPANLRRKYQRWSTTVNSNRALSLKEARELREKNAKARVLRDQEIARKRKAKAAAKKARDEARAARVQAAAVRRVNPGQQPTVRPATATQRRSTPAEMAHSAKCGARCEDGTPCQNPSLGDGPCAAGHNPKVKRKSTYRDNWSKTKQQPGETSDEFTRRHHLEKSMGQFQRDRAKERAQ